MLKGLTIIISFLTSLSISTYGQGWKRPMFQGGFENVTGQTQDGGFFLAGGYGRVGWHLDTTYLLKTNNRGDSMWLKFYPNIITIGNQCVQETTDKGFIIAGNEAYPNDQVHFIKTDSLGNVIWDKDFGNSIEWINALQQTSDGGFILTGTVNDKVNLLRTDQNGNFIWMKSYTLDSSSRSRSVIQTSDNGFAVLVNYSSGGDHVSLLKTNSIGDSLWLSTITHTLTNYHEGTSLIETYDGDFVFTIDWVWKLVKINKYGDSLWTKGISVIPESAQQTADGGFIITGQPFSGYPRNLLKTDSLGNEVWSVNLEIESGLSVKQTDDLGFIVGGRTDALPVTSTTQVLIKTDKYGNFQSDFIEGYVFFDDDQNCENDSFNLKLESWIVEADGIQTNYYGNTDSNGYFKINVPKDDYIVNLIPPNSLWNSPCSGFSVDTNLLLVSDSTTSIDFPLFATIQCPYLAVDISTPFLRRCFDNTYSVQYCNWGTAIAQNVQVEIEFDPYLQLISSSAPWSSQSGNNYTFDLGNVSINQCGSFTLMVYVDCDSSVMGQTHCVIAHIFPDTLCFINPTIQDTTSISTDCHQNVASVDPNEKQSFSKGVKLNTYVSDSTEFEYIIHFQNTGTDTAFTVIIKDTISSFLEMKTVRTGTSSHDYTFKVFGENILEWTFANILLPDSNTNEFESHGFIKFKISQKEHNSVGASITNRAAIYFDFNSPVITNTVLNVVSDGTMSVPVQNNNLINNLIVYPNPTDDYIIIERISIKSTFSLYDIFGKRVLTTMIYPGKNRVGLKNLTSGMYIYKISGTSTAGKILVN